VSVTLFIGLLTLQRLRPGGRIGAIVALVIVSSPIVALLPEISQLIDDFIVNVLRKDPGLTGRAALWARAEDLIARRPLLGYGFQAIWLGDSSDTIGLLRATGQRDGRAFNFHNTYRQFAVDTGLVGMGVLIAILVVSLLAAVRQYIVRPTVATTFFFVFLILALARSHTEVQLVAFSVFTLLFFVCLTYAFWRPTPGWNDEDTRSSTEGVHALPASAMTWRPTPAARIARTQVAPPRS
jgi:exopolysaccharide production protein ExoQ